MPVIPSLRRLRQEYLEFKTNLGYIARLCLRKQEKVEEEEKEEEEEGEEGEEGEQKEEDKEEAISPPLLHS
jgi:hypothetical protein